jgi:hypothetical protein
VKGIDNDSNINSKLRPQKTSSFESNDSSGGGGFAKALLDTKHALLELEGCEFACKGKSITQQNGQSPFRLVVKESFPCELDKLLFGIRNDILSHLSICSLQLGIAKEFEPMMAIYNAAFSDSIYPCPIRLIVSFFA